MNNAIRYQVMPPLSSEEYQELYESIKADGILEPIHVDEEGVVIDGHHRSKIASELGVPCPVITHDDLNEPQKRSLAFTLNLKRRHLNREQRRALGLESLRLDPIASNREHSKRTGLSDNTIRKIRNDQGIPEPREIIAETAEANPEKSNRELARELGVDHKTVGAVRGGENSQVANFPQGKPTATTIPQNELDELNALPTEQPTMEQPQPRRAPITETAMAAVFELGKVIKKLESITEDDRFEKSKTQIRESHFSDLGRAQTSLNNIIQNISQ